MTESCQIIDSYFDLIFVGCLQQHHICHLKASPTGLTNLEWKTHSLVLRNMIFLIFIFWEKKTKTKHCRKTSFFSVGLCTDSFITSNPGCLTGNSRAYPHSSEHLSWLSRGWLPFLAGLRHQPPITQFHVSIFILSQLLFKLGRSVLTLQKPVF